MTFDRESGLQEYLRQQERIFHPLPDVVKPGGSFIPSDPGFGEITGTIPTTSVAANDSSEEDKAKAHVVASGTGDDTDWTAATDLLPASGGRFVIYEGTYNFSGTHQIPEKNVHYFGLGAPVIDCASGILAMESKPTQASGTELVQKFSNLTWTGGGSGTRGIRRSGATAVSLFTTYENLTFRDYIGSACIGSGEQVGGGEQGVEGSIKLIGCNFINVEVLGGGSLNAGVVHDDSDGPPHTAWGCHFEDITHTQGGSACWRIESGVQAIVIGGIYENAGTLESGNVRNVHYLLDGVFTSGSHSDLPVIPQMETFYRSGTLAVVTGKSRLTFPFAATIVNCRATVDTPSTGASIIVDVNKVSGATRTSIYPTSTKPDIAAGSYIGTTRIPDTTAISAGESLSIDIDQVGSPTTEGADLTLTIYYTAN